jgi:hypothetical protein
MQDNPNTDSHTRELLTERDDWEIAFSPYEGKPYEALRLGFNIAMLQTHLEGELFKSRAVIEALDLALEVLFPFTSFHDTSFDLFVRLTQGKLTRDEEQILDALGVKF